MKSCPLFTDLDKEEIKAALCCLGASTVSYAKDEAVYHAGDRIKTLGIVAKGSVCITREDFWGNRNILAKIEAGELFAETYACLQDEELGVNVIAAEASDIIFLDIGKVFGVCGNSCEFHTKLIHNLIRVLAEKNLMLNRKLEHVTQRTTREKLLSYLGEQSRRAHSSEFIIPFNRQQLADYLSVDRSAMSSELGRLQREGIIKFDRNVFKIQWEYL